LPYLRGGFGDGQLVRSRHYPVLFVESGFPGFEDSQDDVTDPSNPLILQILIQTVTLLIKPGFQVGVDSHLVDFPNLAGGLLQEILKLGGAPLAKLGGGLRPQLLDDAFDRITRLHSCSLSSESGFAGLKDCIDG
jgi:hypothetical protein